MLISKNINIFLSYKKNKAEILINPKIWYIKISIASNVAIKYKGDTPIKYYGDV